MKDENKRRDVRLLSKHIRSPEARMAVYESQAFASITAEWVVHQSRGYNDEAIAEIESITVADVRQILAWDKEVDRG